MMTRRTAKTRHTRRHNPHGVLASELIAAHQPPGTCDFAPADTIRMIVPLRPALAAR